MFFQSNEYHDNTKHSYISVRTNPNGVDWNNPPNKFKFYPNDFKRYSLNANDKVSKFLYLIAGISAKKDYSGYEYYLRVNPSAGALYPNEIYLQIRDVKGFENGIYHYEVGTSSITLLKKLESDEGIEANLNLDYKCEGFIFLISSIYYRSSWKYKNRAFRYCLLDAGHLIGTIEASSYIYNKDFEVLFDFEKTKINELFNFKEEEFFTSCVIASLNKKEEKIKAINMNLPNINGVSYDAELLLYEENEKIKNAYQNSLIINEKIEQNKSSKFNYEKNYFEEVILSRRSIRGFSKKSILNEEFQSIYKSISQEVKSDCDELVDIYFVVNRVKGLKIGLYKNNELIKVGDFSKKAGYLCLEQDLGESSAVTFFLTTKSNNYQASYQKAGLIGHRLYLASNYLNIGCSGIGAYYDDEVCEFLEENCMVLYALAIGN